MESYTAWLAGNLMVFYLALFAQIFLSESSPLNKAVEDDSHACAKGWIHYQRFCVLRAEGTTDAAVAMYCGGFGGIGIEGFCITKAHYPTGNSNAVSRLREELLKAAKVGASDAVDDDQGDSLESGQTDLDMPSGHHDDQDVEEVACPKGWSHYRSLCVYRPSTVQERCHHLNAVEFSGLCLKHADTDSLAKRGMKYSSPEKEKRVCCCAHIAAKSNGYGCF